MQFGLLKALLSGSIVFGAVLPVAATAAERDLATVTASIAPTEFIETIPNQAGSEPFGRATARAPRGALWTKLARITADIQAAKPALDRCRADRPHCTEAASRFADIIDQAAQRQDRDRLELVNRRINAAIDYTTDQDQWHVADRWSPPLSDTADGSFETGKGDCEDFAIAKFVALREAGTPAADLRVLIVRDRSAGDYHAVLGVRLGGGWMLLDNRVSRLVESTDARYFEPLFAVSSVDVSAFSAGGPQLAARVAPPPRPARQEPLATTEAGTILTRFHNFAGLLTSSPRNSPQV
ncbi:hypothetical protein DNX69_11645 [Rhodopseudomonas palustris]|uniref:Transglutaminase n=1 Tax=Rhodopseudomonas palustris TaxID=1076 RepID=A0A323UHD6_RHOPL|nr:transglutaminase-like cysteine peptidase [Rhodopseudomonas palustris]PZA11761.1 hypothetical protein DNX69_11645 [Rhodopseudomonas palustris]